MCTVVNKYKSAFDVYIGRGSDWGNPYVMAERSQAERDRVVKAYEVDFNAAREQGIITDEMLIALKGKRLGCFCAPKRCHGDVIAAAVNAL